VAVQNHRFLHEVSIYLSQLEEFKIILSPLRDATKSPKYQGTTYSVHVFQSAWSSTERYTYLSIFSWCFSSTLQSVTHALSVSLVCHCLSTKTKSGRLAIIIISYVFFLFRYTNQHQHLSTIVHISIIKMLHSSWSLIHVVIKLLLCGPYHV